jgi:hypothetical protein
MMDDDDAALDFAVALFFCPVRLGSAAFLGSFAVPVSFVLY